MPVSITDYTHDHHPAIRAILERIGWAEQYISAVEKNTDIYLRDSETYGIYLAVLDS